MQEILKIAFYKGNKTLLQKIIAIWTFGKYSHCAVLIKIDGGIIYTIGASNKRGVAEYREEYVESEWDILEAPCVDRNKVVDFIRDKIGAEYDYHAIWFTHLLQLMKERKDRWFCSEIIAAAIGVSVPHRFHPNSLYKWISKNRREGDWNGD